MIEPRPAKTSSDIELVAEVPLVGGEPEGVPIMRLRD